MKNWTPLQRIVYASSILWAVMLLLLPGLADFYAVSTYSHFDYGPWNVRVDLSASDMFLLHFPYMLLTVVLIWWYVDRPGFQISRILLLIMPIYYGFMLFSGGNFYPYGVVLTMLDCLLLSLLVALAFWNSAAKQSNG